MLAFLLVSQMIVGGAPTPEESARLLAQLDSPSNFSKRWVCTDCDGPHVGVIPSRAGDGPFGPFPGYYFPPLNCCSFYYGGGYYNGYYGGGYGGGPWWSQTAYVSTLPFVRGPSLARRGAEPVHRPVVNNRYAVREGGVGRQRGNARQ